MHDDVEDQFIKMVQRIVYWGLGSLVALVLASSLFLCAMGWKILVA